MYKLLTLVFELIKKTHFKLIIRINRKLIYVHLLLKAQILQMFFRAISNHKTEFQKQPIRMLCLCNFNQLLSYQYLFICLDYYKLILAKSSTLQVIATHDLCDLLVLSNWRIMFMTSFQMLSLNMLVFSLFISWIRNSFELMVRIESSILSMMNIFEKYVVTE